MRAAILQRDPVRIEMDEVVIPRPGAGEVRLRVAGCGACHSDLHKIEGHFGVEPPFVFGHEVSGIVDAVGEGVEGFAPGDAVVCSFLVPCGVCRECAAGRDDNCLAFRAHMQGDGLGYAGQPRAFWPDGETLRVTGVGGFAEYAVVPVAGVFHLPDGVSVMDAAVLGCAGITGFGAVHRGAQLQPGEHAVVIAAGGVGLCVIAAAAYAGAATLIAADVRDEPLELARTFGATAVVNSRQDDLVAAVLAATDGAGADVVFDTVGTPGTVRQAIAATRIGGRVVVTGLASEELPIPMTDVVRRRIRIVGSYAAVTRQDMPRLLEVVAAGRLDPTALISMRRPLDAIDECFTALQRGEVTGRALVEVAAG